MQKYWWLLIIVTGLGVGIVRAQTNHTGVMLGLLDQLIEARGFDDETIEILDEIAASGDELYIAPLIDLGFFVRGRSSPLFDALQTLSEQPFEDDWHRYFEWASASDIALPERYDAWKGTLFARLVDSQFAHFWDGVQSTAQVNLLEPLWGGVQVDGIPSLVNARQISPAEALTEGDTFSQFCRGNDCRYPAPDELVFGVSIDGDNRAYPLRLLNWHEMFNDVIGHAPLYDAPDGEVVCHFRAPTLFAAVARQGIEWVQIAGQSAGCPTSGWFGNPENLNWGGSWSEATTLLPDMAVAGAAALDETAGVAGSVKGKPVMLAYCTLCGSGILYDPTIPELIVNGENLGETVLEFGSTGMLMRSNKMMYDRNTNTVWNAITGEPAFGPLADSGIRLKMLSVVVIDWATWLEEHPDTSVLSLQTGYRRNYANGAAYSDYFNDPTFIMFPVWQQDNSETANKEIIFALNLDNTPKAYPLETIIAEGVTNDIVGETQVVIISRATPERLFFEPGGAAVRAYTRAGYTFAAGVNRSEVIDQNGAIWQITEEALVGPDETRLERLGGHLAFWFGWYSFYPDTLVYQGSP